MQNPMQMMSQFPREEDSKRSSKGGNLVGEESCGGNAVLKGMRQKLQENPGRNESNDGKLESASGSGRKAHLEAEKGRTLDDGEMEKASAVEEVVQREEGAEEETPKP